MPSRFMGGVNPSLPSGHQLGARRFDLKTIFSSPISFNKFRGWYTAINDWESWVSTSTSIIPPSGHSLTNVTLIETWIYDPGRNLQ